MNKLLLLILLCLPFLHAQEGGTTTIQKVNCVSGCSASGGTTFGTAFPSSGGAIGATDGVNFQPLKVDGSDNLNVNCVVGCSTPVGYATSAKQDTGNTSLSSIDSKTPALGQALAAASVPVVLTSAQLATLTPLTTVGLNAGTQVIGHVIVDTAPSTAVTSVDGGLVTLGAKADAKSAATDTTAITIMQVLKEISAMEQAPASRAVTNAGTFAVQAASTLADGADTTLGAKADAKNTATDTTAISVMSVLKEISAMEQAPASRAVTNAGTFAVQAALNAETTKVIGTVNIASAQTIGLVAGSAVIGHVIVDTAPTTAVTQSTSPWISSVAGTVANNAAITQNPVLVSVEANSGQPVAASTGNQRQLLGSLDGALYARPYGPILFSCGLNAIGATLTQCQAAPAAGLSLYITDVITQSSTSTAGLFTLRFGTGTNCVTNPGNLFFGSASALMASPANTSPVNHFHLTTPIKVTAANAVCVLGVATNTTDIQINGFTAP